MEEDSAVKAPVTRLRRRLSVELSEDVKSPGPATPTKKRGGRLAAKPQLDLIEENAPTPGSATKRSTRKPSVKEIAEAEEKPVTPSRRSTRIKSNTSIVSETTTQSYDSPRAKRAAARRTSQVGSDSESSLTPARATRKTRRDSASSVEKLEVTLSSKPSNITEVIIIEETESGSVKSDDNTKVNENATEITPTRKSPRLKGKKQTDKNVRKSIDKKVVGVNNSSTIDETTEEKQSRKSASVTEMIVSSENKETVSPEKTEENVANSSILMVKDLDKKPRKNSSSLNKSTSALDSNNFKSKRQRTKSWTVTSHTVVDEGMFFSDNEKLKKRYNKNQVLKERESTSKHVGSGDHPIINTGNEKSNDQNTGEKNIHKSDNKNSQNESSFTTIEPFILKGLSTPSKSSNSKLNIETISPLGNKENIQTEKDLDEHNEPTKFFEKTPTAILQSTVLFEDSDNDSKGKGMQLDTGDQCVPVVDSELVEKQVTKPLENDKQAEIFNKTNDNNLVDDSCEPMDIDETIPNNVSITEFSQKSFNQTSDGQVPKVQKHVTHSPKIDTSLNKSNNKSIRKSSQTSDDYILKLQEHVTNSPKVDNSLNKSANKSRRKSSLTITENQNLENKSTLILSHIKDISSTEDNTPKSPKISNELSKSVYSTSIVREKVLDKKNVSQDYSTSTPLQQKKSLKLGLQINSSIIDASVAENRQAQIQSKNDVSQISQSSEAASEAESEDEVDSSRPRNSLLDDEAEDASNDYESGDSRDDEEAEYEKNNEIVEKGETLDSDDEVSNDTDYEKDSFVVSSDEEDNELLSGSGDDLSMSDNELSMSKKSKKKYDERKSKDQKKASREMYEARHKLDTSDASYKSRKSKRQKIESSGDFSEEEDMVPVKKRNKLRLDSTQEESLNEANVNDSKVIKKSKRKRLSTSVCDENANIEHEITVYGDNVQNNDPLSVQVKLEPKTPMKEMNISTVQINDNIEEVCIDNNLSVMKPNDTVDPVDPLQETVIEECSSMSENSEIMNNYDSVLKNLNNEKPKKLKTHDMSLNLNKKPKHNKQPIMDQLNITNTKKNNITNTKKVGNDEVDSTQPLKQASKKVDSNEFEDSSSSDFIDMQLLFSEDSNEFDSSQKSKNKEAQDTGDAEDFIPLKRTPGKINILNTEDSTETTKSQVLNESVNSKRCSSKGVRAEQPDDNAGNNNDIQIIIDTQGTHGSINKSLNTSQNASTKKKKNKKNVSLIDADIDMLNKSTSNKELSINEVPYESTKNEKKSRMSKDSRVEDELPCDASNNDTPGEVTTKNKKKSRKPSETHLGNVSGVTNAVDDDAPEEIPYESTKNKKNNRKSSETALEEAQANEVTEKSMSVSLNENSAKKKKKKNYETSELGPVDSTKKKKKRLDANLVNEEDIESHVNNVEESTENSKKRKRKSSANQQDIVSTKGQIQPMNDSIFSESQKKRRKVSQSEEYVQISEAVDICTGSQKKKNKFQTDSADPKQDEDPEPKKKNKKRKERDDDDVDKISKIFKENSYDKVTVTRLPASLINQLDDKPKKDVLEMKKSSVVSTTPFIVEDTRKRRNKPSAFLEESVYLNDMHVEKKKKANIKKPKVLPFIPTAVTSGSGFTTNFKINVIPQEVQFVAQSKNTANFKNDYLYGKKIKRLGTYETYKKHRSVKISKF